MTAEPHETTPKRIDKRQRYRRGGRLMCRWQAISQWIVSARKILSKKQETRARDGSDVEKLIAELFRAVEELASRRKKAEELEGIIAEAKSLAQQWKDPHSAHDRKGRRPLFDATASNTHFLLAALRRDHELVAQIRTHFPSELETLSSRSLLADLLKMASYLPEPKLKPNQKYERNRRSKWLGVGEIKRQFGGATSTVLTLRALGP